MEDGQKKIINIKIREIPNGFEQLCLDKCSTAQCGFFTSQEEYLNYLYNEQAKKNIKIIK